MASSLTEVEKLRIGLASEIAAREINNYYLGRRKRSEDGYSERESIFVRLFNYIEDPAKEESKGLDFYLAIGAELSRLKIGETSYLPMDEIAKRIYVMATA